MIAPRRDFLRGLVSLPLIGGSVALFGQPTAVAEPATLNLLDAYKTWLHYEHRSVAWEMAELPEIVAHYGGDRCARSKTLCDFTTEGRRVGRASSYHRYDGVDPAAGRAALVLSTVGCDWHRRWPK